MPTISMRAAASSMKRVERHQRQDRLRPPGPTVVFSIRSSLPSTVWRAIESAGKLVSDEDQIVAMAHGAAAHRARPH